MNIHHRKGFTLIEVLVVVLIIGILAAVALPQYQKAVYKSRYASLKNLTKSFANAEELFYMSNGTYTLNLNELDIEAPFSSVDDTHETYIDYIFDWGLCRLSSTAFTKCRNNSVGMDYQIYFNHSKKSGTRVCVVLNDKPNSMQAQICKQETGKDTPTKLGTGWHSYTY